MSGKSLTRKWFLNKIFVFDCFLSPVKGVIGCPLEFDLAKLILCVSRSFYIKLFTGATYYKKTPKKAL